MDCKQFCPLSFTLLGIPLLRSDGYGLQQTSEPQLPWWLWLVFILLALIVISWWQFYLRPLQAQEVHELEQLFVGNHGSHPTSHEHDLSTRIVGENPQRERIDHSAKTVHQVEVADSESLEETDGMVPDDAHG